jgi:polysaccharide export outer membrane protein
MRALSSLSFVGIYVSVIAAPVIQPVVAQTLPSLQKLPQNPLSPVPGAIQGQPPIQPPAPPQSTDFTAPGVNDEISPQFNRYILGPGDGIGISVVRPQDPYVLGPGDAIAVSVLRFPDLSFQAVINPEGNIVVPLLGTVSLRGLSLQQAQEKIRVGLNRFVVDPIVTLALVGQRPDLNFGASINTEGNIVLPQVGTLSLQGLTLEEAEEKIRQAYNRIFVQPTVSVSLQAPRPVQVTVAGEVNRPGIYPVAPGASRVGDALLVAGGATKMADLREVEVRRKLIDGSTVSETVDLYTPLQNGGSIPNLRLQDGDALIVRRREIANDDTYDNSLVARSTLSTPQIRVRVLNYAAGGIVTIPLPNGSNFLDALTGINPSNADLSDIALVRFDPERGRAVRQKLNARKALAGDASQNVPLQDNDVIVVGRTLVARITNALSTITRPFFDIRGFLDFFGLDDN